MTRTRTRAVTPTRRVTTSHANGVNRPNTVRSSRTRYSQGNVTASRHFHYRGGAYRGPAGYSYRRWSYGQTLPSIYFAQNYWIDDYSYYGLAYPPEDAVWVRYGPDALLIDRDSGAILEVVYGQFY